VCLRANHIPVYYNSVWSG